MTEWFTVSKLSPHQDWSPEGFLVCKDVPIARTGTQLYRNHEIPHLDADDDGWITVSRDAAEVFSPSSIASFAGKPVTDDHPYEAVGPDNWDRLAIGTVHNVRRGTGDQQDLLLADLVLNTRRGIDLVRRGKRAISVGYDAHYERTGRGLGRQRNIVANHVAIVDEGRCGSRCTIIDGKPHYWDTTGSVVEGELERPEETCDVDYDDTADVDYRDREFVESEHPRDPKGTSTGGEFTSGGGGGASGETTERNATELLPEVPDYSEDQAKELGAKIAEEAGAAEYVAQARAKLAQVEAERGEKWDTMAPVSRGGFLQEEGPDKGKFTPERAQLHDKILDELFSPEAILNALPEPGQKPVMTMLGGRGGSGKSWISDPEKGGPVDPSKAILVDADKFKEKLGMQGWDAAHYHEESDHLVSRAAERAQKAGVNVIHDATLKTPKSALERMAAYKNAGYDVDGYYMHLPPEMATRRAMDRYARGMEKNGKGRFVPPEVIMGNKLNERTFDAMRNDFRHWGIWENKGSAPKFHGGSQEVEKRYGGTREAKDRRPIHIFIHARTARLSRSEARSVSVAPLQRRRPAPGGRADGQGPRADR